MTPSFAAAVLAGGQSQRMGTDKAFLNHPDSQRSYWQHQQALLRSLGPSILLISANGEQSFDYALVVRDRHVQVGPIGGLLACLEAIQESRLLVLAVDMIAMTVAPLQSLLEQSTDVTGAVYRDGAFYQPTAAVYPRIALESIRAFHQAGGRRLQELLQQLIDTGFMRVLDLPASQRGLFANINTAGDLTDV